MKKLLLLTLIALTGCIGAGRMSANDARFKESPSVVTKDGRYFLRFRYSDDGMVFFMMTSSRVESDRLVFYIAGTSSTGSTTVKGKLQFEEIVSPEKLALAKQGKVSWEESKNNFIPLKLEPMQEELDVLGQSVSGRPH